MPYLRLLEHIYFNIRLTDEELMYFLQNAPLPYLKKVDTWNLAYYYQPDTVDFLNKLNERKY